MKTMQAKQRPADRCELVIHAGAHRTGTTSLQALLDRHAETLRGAGVVALTPERPGKRGAGTIRDVVNAARKKRFTGDGVMAGLRRRKIAGQFEKLLASATSANTDLGRLIVSDEMLLGPAFDAKGTGLYPAGASILAGFSRITGRLPHRIHLTLRSYDTFIPSVYAMRSVYVRGVPEFEELKASLIAFEFGWPELVRSIRREFPETELTVTTMETTTVVDLVRSLIGEAFEKISESTETRINASPTKEAITAARDTALSHVEADRIIEQYAGGTPFDPLSPAEASRLRSRYKRDIDTIENLLGNGLVK